MRILVISHSCVVSEYRKRISEVAKYGEVDLNLLVPKRWIQYNSWVSLEKEKDDSYRIISVQPRTWALGDTSLRNVTHVYPRIKSILEDVNPDIIEIWEEPFSMVTAHTIFCAKRVKNPIKIIFFSAQNINKKYPFPFCSFEKYTYKNADYAFLMNNEVATTLQMKGYNKDFLILPLGVDPEFFCKKDVSHLKKELGIRDFVVGFIGKIARQKGILDLVEAASRINKEIQLLIIGNGDLREEVGNRLKALGFGQRAFIIDAVPHSQVPDYLNCMDVLVLPSVTFPHLKEQFGRVIIEGMACEVPVIGSDSGEIPATIGKAGLIFKEKDIAGLKGKIEALIRDRNLRTMLAKNGRKRVLENFSWKVIAEKQHQVYTELISREK
ncbi:MAG: glycosyltransferase family 4 protein [Candidatus Hodarchaeota archaeon]